MPKVLIATDGSDFAIAAAKKASELLAPASAVTVLAVVPQPVLPAAAPVTGLDPGAIVTPEATEELDQALTEEARVWLDRTVEALGGRAERLSVHGDPATEICRLAQDGGFDVIALGSHGFGFVKRVVLGSVSHHVLQHAPCPVLVVRASDRS
ncbi:MAG: universal stress protein UspA [Acidimicrobiales bacterium]|nr:universal stress protein UspA [Acidimicrobiales bacterium]